MLETLISLKLDSTVADNYVIFQQDGTPFQYNTSVRELLDQEFPNKWIGCHGSIKWSPQSPNLIPMDISSGEFVMEKVFSQKHFRCLS